MNTMFGTKNLQPYVRIIEQPARSAVRFRYECEGRTAGPIPGVNSSPSYPTHPTIQIMSYAGSHAMVVVSCVTVSEPFRQHPHHLVGRVGCHNGIFSMVLDRSNFLLSFTHLGIQCAKRNEIGSRLELRKQLQIDPTFGGFEHISNNARGVDLGCVRLCFQAFLEGPEPDKFCIPLEPVISAPVYDKKLLSKLFITDISTNHVVVTGGKVMIFCNYIDEDDIEVIFYECDSTGITIWQCKANLKPPFGEVHKKVGLSFLAPPYKDLNVTHNVKCYLQLRRASDHEVSEPFLFYYIPLNPQHNCPYIQHMSPGRQLSGNSNIFESENVFKQLYENNRNYGEMRESKPETTKPAQTKYICQDLVSGEKALMPSNIIEGDLNGEPLGTPIEWNIPHKSTAQAPIELDVEDDIVTMF